jgi:hypothetical protein
VTAAGAGEAAGAVEADEATEAAGDALVTPEVILFIMLLLSYCLFIFITILL